MYCFKSNFILFVNILSREMQMKGAGLSPNPTQAFPGLSASGPGPVSQTKNLCKEFSTTGVSYIPPQVISARDQH